MISYPCKVCQAITTNPNRYCDKHQNEYKAIINRQDRPQIYNTMRWQKIRAIVLSNNPLCEICENNNLIIKATTVHHKDSNPENNELKNLQALCRDCHEKIHGR